MDANSGSIPWEWVEFQGAGRDFDVARYEAARWVISDACAWSMMGRNHRELSFPILQRMFDAPRERLRAFNLIPPAGFDTHRDARAWLMTAFERACDGRTHLERAMLTQDLYSARVSVARVYLPDEDAKETLLSDLRAFVRVGSTGANLVAMQLMSLASTLDQHPDAELEREVELVTKAWCQSLFVGKWNIEGWSILRPDGSESFATRLEAILKKGLGSLVINPKPDNGASA